MRNYLWILVISACVPPTTSPSSIDSTPTTPTGDTSVPMVLVHHGVFEADRQCWAVRDEPRPEVYWGDYIENDCPARVTLPSPMQSDDAGLCIGFWGPFEGDCAVSDPWLKDCSESVEPACCTTLQNMPACDPGAYQP